LQAAIVSWLLYNQIVIPTAAASAAAAAAAASPILLVSQVLQQALKDLESYWLAGGARPFMTGQQVSVPDVLCVCELEQLR
jgi:hypothetical protein